MYRKYTKTSSEKENVFAGTTKEQTQRTDQEQTYARRINVARPSWNQIILTGAWYAGIAMEKVMFLENVENLEFWGVFTVIKREYALHRVSVERETAQGISLQKFAWVSRPMCNRDPDQYYSN